MLGVYLTGEVLPWHTQGPVFNSPELQKLCQSTLDQASWNPH